MNPGLLLLCLNSAAIAIVHTVIGPDHYVPFVAMARARRWSAWRTTLITLACGIGHIASSTALGVLGVAFGVSLERITRVESFRGSVATWALIAFGAVYLAWGLRRAYRRQTHIHGHSHLGMGHHVHGHPHDQDHAHVHDEAKGKSLTPWVLFTIFVFGPCEPMIPLIMFPAAGHDWVGVALVTAVFGTVTIVAMLALVQLGLSGVRLLPLEKMERFGHAMAGATILATGGAVQIFAL